MVVWDGRGSAAAFIASVDFCNSRVIRLWASDLMYACILNAKSLFVLAFNMALGRKCLELGYIGRYFKPRHWGGIGAVLLQEYLGRFSYDAPFQ